LKLIDKIAPSRGGEVLKRGQLEGLKTVEVQGRGSQFLDQWEDESGAVKKRKVSNAPSSKKGDGRVWGAREPKKGEERHCTAERGPSREGLQPG